MMSKKILCILVLFPMVIFGQTIGENYVKSITYKTPTSQGTVDVNNLANATIQVSYFDGLGRPIQQIAHKQSNSGKDIVTHIEYDTLGRQVKEYLPYKANQDNLGFVSGAKSQTQTFYLDSLVTVSGNPHFDITSFPYSEKLLEASPLNRVFEQAAPGDDWSLNATYKHTIRFDYQTNVSNEVKQFSVTTIWNSNYNIYDITIVDNGHYAINELYKTITKNENWVSGDNDNNTTQEFKDKEGKVILKRTFGVSVVGSNPTNTSHDTYYVYDGYGNLTYVIPPLAEGATDTTTLNGLCYQYKYDSRNRLVEKKLPGKQWEYIVYDKLDRVVYTGPTFTPFGGTATGWMFTKYDAFGRVCYIGWTPQAIIDSSRRKILQNSLNNTTISNAIRTNSTIDGITINYSNTDIPSGLKLLTVNYYDNYDYPNPPTIPTTIEGQNNILANVKGLPTGSWTRVMLNNTSAYSETSYTIYNEKAQPIRAHKKNFIGGYTRTDSKLDFLGKPLYTLTYHKRESSSTEIITKDEFSYTPQDKLEIHTHTINNGTPELLAHNQYDELGQLITKDVGGTDTSSFTGLQTVDYQYNIRGWLTQINDVSDLNVNHNVDLFAFKLSYNTLCVGCDLSNQIKPLYNGNISETFWKTNTDNILRKYSYAYDNLNRLNKALYQKNDNISLTHSYDEEIAYDKNGNITNLLRNGDSDTDDVSFGGFQIDDLSYDYDPNYPNRLVKVTDTTTSTLGFKDGTNTNDDFGYDDNGNMTSDQNKGITSIVYNHLNLPTQIIFGNGNYIHYSYNALGEKVQKEIVVVTTNGGTATTDYLDGYQYTNNVLKFFTHAEGYVNVNGILCNECERQNIYSYVFNYTDHLGNIRVSYGVDPQTNNLEILEENHYYPFGLKHTNYNSDTKEFAINEVEQLEIKGVPAGMRVNYNYKFQGQERQDELGLNLDSFKWRNYDYAIGRFMNIDPLAEKYSYQSPYNFSENRVIDCRELEGLEAVKSTDGNNVNVTVRVRPVNCSSDFPISNQQMQTAMSNFVSQSNKNYTGKNAEGQQVNFNFINDPEATLTMEFLDRVSYPGGYTGTGADYYTMSTAYGAVTNDDLGNTQSGNMQISTFNSFPQEGDTESQRDKKRPGGTGSHEMGHIFGLLDLELGKDPSTKKVESTQKNLMYRDVRSNNGTEITDEQRSEILKNIPFAE